MKFTQRQIAFGFLLVGLISLCSGAGFGMLGSLQYVLPDFLRDLLPFQRVQPLHTALVVSWILIASTGGIYYYLQANDPLCRISGQCGLWHLALFSLSGFAVVVSLAFGFFGGREYMAYPPIFSVPILAGWVLFAIHFIRMNRGKFRAAPVYIWMWATGIFFFIFTFLEAHLYLLPYFRENLVRELTVQWKSYGALVGSWNMLVYGTAYFVMSVSKGAGGMSRSRMAFALYFLSLANLMFGWGHHTYILPAMPWIRIVAYAISMSEWLILGKIIWDWRRGTMDRGIRSSTPETQLLLAADIWIFLNLFLALLMSVPALNLFTHGTHITVAHAMGTTIGINTNILLASCYYIYSNKHPNLSGVGKPYTATAIRVLQVSLGIFWIGLILAGLEKAQWQYEPGAPGFREIQAAVIARWSIVMISGAVMFIAFLVLATPLIRFCYIRLCRQ